MSLAVLAAYFGKPEPTPARPSRAAEDACLAARRARAGRPADDSQRLAVAMVRGVAAIPAGRERARECAARRAELAQGIASVLRALEAVEKALRAPEALWAGSSGGEPSSELRRHMKCLRWAGSMTNALQTAARTLRTLDSFNTPEREYSELAEQLSIIKEALRDFWGVTLDSCSTALRRPEQVDKLEALSETCSTASGCASEASSEADCDSPRGCRSCEAPSASPDLADEICKGGRPCSPSGAWTALMHWA